MATRVSSTGDDDVRCDRVGSNGCPIIADQLFIAARRFSGRTVGLVMGFGAGAMLTMLADAMMPEAFDHGGKTVDLSTVLGFLTAAVLSTRA